MLSKSQRRASSSARRQGDVGGCTPPNRRCTTAGSLSFLPSSPLRRVTAHCFRRPSAGRRRRRPRGRPHGSRSRHEITLTYKSTDRKDVAESCTFPSLQPTFLFYATNEGGKRGRKRPTYRLLTGKDARNEHFDYFRRQGATFIYKVSESAPAPRAGRRSGGALRAARAMLDFVASPCPFRAIFRCRSGLSVTAIRPLSASPRRGPTAPSSEVGFFRGKRRFPLTADTSPPSVSPLFPALHATLSLRRPSAVAPSNDAYHEAKGGIKMCAKGRENRKKIHRLPSRQTSAARKGLLEVLKSRRFWHIVVTNGGTARPPRGAKKCGRNFNKSRTCSNECGTCCAASAPPFSGRLLLKILTSRYISQARRRMIFPSLQCKQTWKRKHTTLIRVNFMWRNVSFRRLLLKNRRQEASKSAFLRPFACQDFSGKYGARRNYFQKVTEGNDERRRAEALLPGGRLLSPLRGFLLPNT